MLQELPKVTVELALLRLEPKAMCGVPSAAPSAEAIKLHASAIGRNLSPKSVQRDGVAEIDIYESREIIERVQAVDRVCHPGDSTILEPCVELGQVESPPGFRGWRSPEIACCRETERDLGERQKWRLLKGY